MKTKNKTSKNKLEASKKYHNKLEEIKIRVPIGYRNKIKEFADQNNMSVNQLLIFLLNSYARHKKFELNIPNGIKEGSGKEKEIENGKETRNNIKEIKRKEEN